MCFIKIYIFTFLLDIAFKDKERPAITNFARTILCFVTAREPDSARGITLLAESDSAHYHTAPNSLLRSIVLRVLLHNTFYLLHENATICNAVIL